MSWHAEDDIQADEQVEVSSREQLKAAQTSEV